MARVEWGRTGERFFETGIDRGMLYVEGYGVPWNGLVSVEERPTGAEARPFYLDGEKYANVASSEEFEATITAYGAPKEFDLCDGTTQIANGLFITQQPRRPFGMSYRTKIGNDLDAADHAYKIHLIYNALAAPSTRNNSTTTDSPGAVEFSWDVTTLPASIFQHKSTAHVVIDSRSTDPVLLRDIEDILYGSSFLMPRLPLPQEMVSLFAAPSLVGRWAGVVNTSISELVNGRTGEVLRRNLDLDPRFTILNRSSTAYGTGGTGTKALVVDATDGPILPDGTQLKTYLRSTVTATNTGGSPYFDSSGLPADALAMVAPPYVSMALYVRPSVASSARHRAYGHAGSSSTTVWAGAVSGKVFELPANVWTQISGSYAVATDSLIDHWRNRAEFVNQILPVGMTVDITASLIEATNELRPYFDGNSVFP